MIVFLTEEESMKVTLDKIISRFWPDKVSGVDWITLAFQGKSDLEKNIARKMNSWKYGTPHFLILRDRDGSDCMLLKERLSEIAAEGSHPFTVRVVCNELESWFLGELDAIEAVCPSSRASGLKGAAKFRVPDDIVNASQEIERLVNIMGKVGRAAAIASHFDPEKCVSRSFQVFWRTTTFLMSKPSV
jgi:hypothetical protein